MNVLKRKLPLGAVAFALVLVLAAMGLGYGNWSQTLSIGGTVTTGGMSAEWNEPVGFEGLCTDNEGGKDVAQTHILWEPGAKVLGFTLVNGYPNYRADCEPEIHYTGQIPGVIESITFTPKEGLDCDIGQSPSLGTFEAICSDSDTGGPALQVNWNNGLCTQLIDEELSDKLASSLIVEVLKDAEEKAIYGFNISVEIVQWDKTTCS